MIKRLSFAIAFLLALLAPDLMSNSQYAAQSQSQDPQYVPD